MRNQARWHRLLCLPVFVAFLISSMLIGCTSSSSTKVSVGGTLALTAANAAAVGGLAFHFADGSLFGFAGQDLTLTLGADGTTFTLTTSRGTVVSGTLTFGSCTFTQTPASEATSSTLFMQTYTICQVSGTSKDDIGFGGSGNGTLTLSLGQSSSALVNSEPLNVVYSIDLGGKITINTNTTPIGVTE